MFWGMVALAVTTLPLALVPHWTAAGLGFVASSIFFSVTVGPSRILSQEMVRPHWRATMAAAFMMGSAVSYSAVSYLGGQIITDVSYEVLFLIGIGMVAAGAAFFAVYFRRPRVEGA
jgi:predicted MFS family arabinose efflux permease